MKTLEKEFVDYLSRMAKSFGLDELAIRVFAVLYIEPEEIAMEDIAKKTGYSLASISNTMKMLEAMGQVKRIRKPGTRKVFFYMGKDLIRWNIMKLDFAMDSIVRPAKENLPQIIKTYKSRVRTDADKKRLEIVKGYHDQVLLFESLLKKWRTDLRKLK